MRFKLLERILELIYPNKCIYCNELIPIGGDSLVCEECSNNIKVADKPRCIMCDRPIKITAVCHICKDMNIYFDKGFAVYNYEGKVKNAILNFKYNNKKRNCKPFSDIMLKYFLENSDTMPDIIVPVPLYKKRYRKRGFNQSELLAIEISKGLGIETLNVLDRIKETKPQSGLKMAQRIKNLKGAFALNEKYEVKDKNILIIDDIFTTGATCNECAKVLRKNGAQTIMFLTIASVRDAEKN